MATTWGAFSGHLRVGIDVTTGSIVSGTTSTTVSVHFYVQVDSTWNFADNQAMEVSGSIAAHYDYYNGLGANAILKVGQYNFNANLSYSGGPTYTFKGTVSGHYQGATPTHSRSWTLPARVGTTPGAPGVSISNVDNDSAKVTVSAPSSDGGSTITAYSTQVDNNSNFGSPHATWGGGTGTVTGLAAATTYYARSRAQNAYGWGPWSATKSFTTGATTPTVPTAFVVGTVDATTANLDWGPPNNDGGSAIDDYTVQYATNSNFTANVVYLTVEPTEVTLTGLTPGDKYFARVRANNGVGAGTYTSTKSFTTLAGTPSIYSPADGSTIGNGVIDVTVTAAGIASDQTITLEVSQDNTFVAGVKTVTLSPSGPSSNDRYRMLATGQYLDSGTWYARVKVTNNTTGYVTPWSSTVSFVQSHVPAVAIQSPTAGQVSTYGASSAFIFQFTDSAEPYDWMTAYQLTIEDDATSEVVFDSTKTALVTDPNDNSITINVPLADTYKSVPLRWRVRAWDRGDDVSAYTGWGLFTLADPPIITITEPSDILPVETGSPTFAWEASFPSGGSQVRADVEVYEQDTLIQVWEATVIGSGTSVTPDVVILRNAINYYVDVTLTDSTGLQGTATRAFLTAYDAPLPFPYFINASNADTLGYIEVDWSDANPDELFAAWKVYRRIPGGQWELLDTITNQNTRIYRDYMITAGSTYSYSITQVATRSGSLLESPVGYYLVGEDQEVAETRTFLVDLSYYWLINPEDTNQNIRLINVTEDSSTLEFEDATYTIIGRGRHHDYGDELGYSGTITCQVRIPERPSQFRLQMEALRRARETYYLRTPFGNLFPVALGNLGWSPVAGVGNVEMGDMTIPYEEVH